ncbi:MAG: PAS domain-containing sensor histidine kinase [Luteitalea sp.]|nr:PAS domain-containing sensor histidine kinase [Luteitalea sp.]
MPRRRFQLRHDQRVAMLALAAAAPGLLISLLLLWMGDFAPRTQWTLTILILVVSLGCLGALRSRVIMPLQTLANLLEALREGDFSFRARSGRSDDPLTEVTREVNTLADTLRTQRLDAVEATALLTKVMAEIDVAVFAFDARAGLQLVNRAGERLLGKPAEELLQRDAAELGLEGCLEEEGPRIRALSFPGGTARWEIRTSTFRQHGLPHHLLVLSDVSKPLREEERQAWQRLIRVIGHELNNSLAPIKSIAASLASLLGRDALPTDWRDDSRRGLQVISTRAEALNRFMSGYARLAKLPPPKLAPLHVRPFVERVVSLETRMRIDVHAGPDCWIRADGDQLEQLLINLIRNAVDATSATRGRVWVGWARHDGRPRIFELWVDDEGPGIANPANLFVPLFSTKPGGTGIGLVLCQQIAEAHGGLISLENRPSGRGARATLKLPT